MAWHQMESNEVLEELGSTEEGLGDAEARERLQKYGPNRLAEAERINWLIILLHQFTSPLIYILLVAAAVTYFLKEFIDASVVVAVLLLNAVIGFIQEFGAEKRVQALKRLVVAKARVIRDGKEKEIPGEELVPGDIVLVASGMKVPADLRLFHCIELRADEAMLTGESLPVEKTTSPIADEKAIPADQTNMAFMGTSVVNGRAKGVVVATAGSTILGSIASEVGELGPRKAPIQLKIDRFAKVIGMVVMVASAVLFVLGLFLGESVKEMFMTAVAAAVAAIPEGLPIVVTIAMAVGVARMASHNAIVRKLPAVETLGSATVICSDKTGTLTRNEMTVQRVFDGSRSYEVAGTGYDTVGDIFHEGEPVEAKEHQPLLHLLRIGLLCNEADLYQEESRLRVDGDPTEGALIVSACKAGLDPEEERRRFEQVAIIPFESGRGYMATLHAAGGRKEIFVKGSPERVVEMCSFPDAAAGEVPLHAAGRMAAEGMRVLAFASKEVPAEVGTLGQDDAASGLAFAGLQGMMDPPRSEVLEAVAECKRAGIRVVMITGDHPATAQAIAHHLGIAAADGKTLTGRQLEAMSDDELFVKVRDTVVYARVSPEHKLRITQQLVKNGEIVAMTGDGVNDAPALKCAHIGIAMGITGTDVAKEASDMVLADDNFASIFQAVKEGRIVFDNLRKVTFFLIPTGAAAILSIVGTMVMGLPIPYLPAQLLWINLVTNGLQDVALSFEPGEKGIIDRPPRPPKEAIMSRLLVERTLLVGLVISAGVTYNFFDALNSGQSVENARTVAVTTMVFFQFFQAINSRSEYDSIFHISPFSNPFLFYSMLAAFFAQLAVLYVPPLQWVFRTVPLNQWEWAQILVVAATVLVVVEIDKWLRKRLQRGRASLR